MVLNVRQPSGMHIQHMQTRLTQQLVVFFEKQVLVQEMVETKVSAMIQPVALTPPIVAIMLHMPTPDYPATQEIVNIKRLDN